MTTTAYFRYSKVLRRVHEGPLGVHIDIYTARLLREGHCYQSGARWPRSRLWTVPGSPGIYRAINCFNS